MTMSAGVDMSMAVTTTGEVYAWGKTDGGRLGLGYEVKRVRIPKRVEQITSDGKPIKAVDVDCGYVHSIVVGLNGTIHVTGSVGINDQNDGETGFGIPSQVDDFNIWHRIPEPKETVKTERWQKYGTYKVQGRRKMLDDPVD
jgi:alpha-tubulin suppressor-like RCC1 family protein